MQTALRNFTCAWVPHSSSLLSQYYGGKPCRFGLPTATALLSCALLWYHAKKDEIVLSVILCCGMTRHSPTCRCQPVLHEVIWGREHALKGKFQPALQYLGWDSEPLEQSLKSTTVLATVGQKMNMFSSTVSLCFCNSVRHVRNDGTCDRYHEIWAFAWKKLSTIYGCKK